MADEREGNLMPSTEKPECLSHLSGIDAIKLLEVIHESISCNSEEDFINLYPKIQELFPFDFAAAMLGHHDSRKGAVILHGVNISFPEEWCREYFSRNYHQTSALSRRNFMDFRPQYMTDTWKKYRQPNEIISLCLDFRIREGYAHGLRPTARGQNGSMFAFSGMSMKYDRRTVALLELAVPHLHLALSRIFENKGVENKKTAISAREKEVLDWLKLGKSSWDISVIMGISERTVNYHVYNIMQKLDAVNRPQAVAAAVHLGLIDIE
ncbi:MAG TPA: LuxR C-terminal-related transcriptional regulator [Geobacteraceae bacterium]|nr:LuxR C-terminal-related transcriptional regulator [Geobacteraceae bacterium]